MSPYHVQCYVSRIKSNVMSPVSCPKIALPFKYKEGDTFVCCVAGIELKTRNAPECSLLLDYG